MPANASQCPCSIDGTVSFDFPGTPKGLPITIVNHDTGVTLPIGNMNLSFSEAFLSQLDSDVMTKTNMSSIKDGMESVKNGSAWAVLEFGKNFSQDSFQR